MSVDRSQVSASDSVRISLVFTNRTSRTVRTLAADSYGFCNHAFQVFDQRDRQVAVLEGFCAQALIAVQWIDLPPGESITIVDYWRPASSTLDGQPPPPGRYHVVARVSFDNQMVTAGPAIVVVTP